MSSEEKRMFPEELVETEPAEVIRETAAEEEKQDASAAEQVQRLQEMEAELTKKSTDLKDKIDALLWSVQKSDIALYVEMYRHPVKMFTANVWMGVGRGIGYLIGFAIGGALLVYILNQIVEINIPLIGDFVAEVVKIVQYQLGQPGVTIEGR